MSSGEFLKKAATADSNIPIAKKNTFGIKKTKRNAHVTELQRYIESIIKASDENDSKKVSQPEKGSKTSRESSDVRLKVKSEMQTTTRKCKKKEKTPFTEAVSHGADIDKFAEGSRNWQTGDSPSLVVFSKLESFFKKIYPNPYCIENVKGHKTVEGDLTDEKDLVKTTATSLSIDNETEVDKEKITTVASSTEIESSKREIDKSAFIAKSSAENCNKRYQKGKNYEEYRNKHLVPTKLGRIINAEKKNAANRSSHTTITSTSSPTSMESMNEIMQSQSQANFKKTHNSDLKKNVGRNSISKKEKKPEKPKIYEDDSSLDYDIGKLKLLSVTDSEESLLKSSESAFKNKENSSKSNDYIDEDFCEDLNEVRQIYDVVDKAAERCFSLSSKVGSVAELNGSDTTIESEKLWELINKLSNEDVKPQDENPKEKHKCDDVKKRQKLEISLPQPKTDSEEISLNEKEPIIEMQYSSSSNDSSNTEVQDQISDYATECSMASTSALQNTTSESQQQVESKPLIKKKIFHPPSSNRSTESLTVKPYPRVKEIQGEASALLDEIRKKTALRSRWRKRLEKNSPLAKKDASARHARPNVAILPVSRSFETNSNADSSIISQSRIQTVESQNELGSYTEESQETILINNTNQSNIKKPVHPLSISMKKSKTDRSIKDVLDMEEKLLKKNSNTKIAAPEKKNQNITPRKQPNRQLLLRNNRSMKACSLIKNFKRSVQCDSEKNWYAGSVPPKLSLQKILPQTTCTVSTQIHNVKVGALYTLTKPIVLHTARPVCLKATFNIPAVGDELFTKSSHILEILEPIPFENFLQDIEFKEDVSDSLIIPQDPAPRKDEDDPKPVESLIEALKMTEKNLLRMEKNEKIDDLKLTSDMLRRNDTNEIRCWGESNTRRVQDLLLRTYSLQCKLQGYLEKLTSQSVVLTCPIIQQETLIFSKNTKYRKITTDEPDRSDPPLSPWHVMSSVNSLEANVVDEATTVEIQTIDHETSYSTPTDDEEVAPKNDNDTQPQIDDDSDDTSSTYSFKSSNDLSETNETYGPEKEQENTKLHTKLWKSESSNHNFPIEKPETLQRSPPSENLEHSKNDDENSLIQYDQKTPAKVLKTVFKNKESLTELSIGLKDIPMTKVSNISVEKKKFSENHTKISICISKEKLNELEKLPNHSKAVSGTLNTKLSTLYYDQTQPFYPRLDVDVSKTSMAEGTDDDEDDFKSVTSTFSNSEVDIKTEEKKHKEHKSSSKTYTKHRFDIYRKLDMNFNQSKHRVFSNVLCRYKELEPLKQALSDMKIRMQTIKRDMLFNNNEYYERALKLAKMSAGYCQNCGNRAVIPKDTFGYYKTIFPRGNSSHHRQFKSSASPNSSFYSFHSGNADVSDLLSDLDMKRSSSYLLNSKSRSKGAIFRSSLDDMPLIFREVVPPKT